MGTGYAFSGGDKEEEAKPVVAAAVETSTKVTQTEKIVTPTLVVKKDTKPDVKDWNLARKDIG